MEMILVPLDGSELAALALPHAVMFSKLLGVELRLLHVVTEGDRQGFVIERERLMRIATDAGPVTVNPEPDLELHADTYLEQEAAKLRAQGAQVRTEVAFGTPVEQIVAAAERCAARLIVMATHGRGGIGRWLIGSVAHSVMRLTARPLLVIRNAAPVPSSLQRIMVPLDGSPLAREALPMALDLAQRTGATLMLLSVLTPQSGRDLHGTPQSNAVAKGALREQLLHELGTFEADCRDLSITTVIGEGHVGDTICREAEQNAADLIVMTSHGQSGLHHFALGSVTDKVLHGTHVPVLVMHSQAHEAEAVGDPGQLRHRSG